MKIDLSYQTQQLPPPYAFAASFSMNTHAQRAHLRFQLEYLEREELSQEEILQEGFTMEDDFSWEGALGKNWLPILKGFDELAYQDEPSEEAYLHVKIDGVEKGFPKEDQELIVQELIQAAFESSDKESLLKIQLLDEEMQTQEFTWHFADRSFLIGNHAYQWDKGRALMNFLYTLEFEENAVSQQPQPGSLHYQNTGEWLQITDRRLMEKISKLIQELKKA